MKKKNNVLPFRNLGEIDEHRYKKHIHRIEKEPPCFTKSIRKKIMINIRTGMSFDALEIWNKNFHSQMCNVQ